MRAVTALSDLSRYAPYANVEDRRGVGVRPVVGGLKTEVPMSVWADPFPTARMEMAYGASGPAPVDGEDLFPARYKDHKFYNLSERSFHNLSGVDPRLVAVIGTAIIDSPFDFIVIDGLRTRDEQRRLLSEGKTKTLNSRHLTGHAVDLAIWHEGEVKWVPEMYRILARHVLGVAERHGVPLEWGGDFREFFDGPHFQLPWSMT